MRRDPLPADWHEDARSGLNVIATRADSLSRFMEAYARLARLPPPLKEQMDIGEVVNRAANLETRLPVQRQGGPQISIRADAGQVEQALINLLYNAAEASLPTRGAVTIGWKEAGESVDRDGIRVEVLVSDELRVGQVRISKSQTAPNGGSSNEQ